MRIQWLCSDTLCAIQYCMWQNVSFISRAHRSFPNEPSNFDCHVMCNPNGFTKVFRVVSEICWQIIMHDIFVVIRLT